MNYYKVLLVTVALLASSMSAKNMYSMEFSRESFIESYDEEMSEPKQGRVRSVHAAHLSRLEVGKLLHATLLAFFQGSTDLIESTYLLVEASNFSNLIYKTLKKLLCRMSPTTVFLKVSGKIVPLSPFHCIVRIAHSIQTKKEGFNLASTIVDLILPCMTYLRKQGITDTLLCEGETSEQLAQRLHMDYVASIIRIFNESCFLTLKSRGCTGKEKSDVEKWKACYTTLHYKSEQEVGQLLHSAFLSVLQRSTDLLDIACLLIEASKFSNLIPKTLKKVLVARGNKTLSLKIAGESTLLSPFHLIVRIAHIIQTQKEDFNPLELKEDLVIPLITLLKNKGIDGTVVCKGETSEQLAQRLHMGYIASVIELSNKNKPATSTWCCIL